MKDQQTRNEVTSLFAALVVGPLQEGEELEAPPSDTYMTGLLWPSGEELDASEDDAGENQTEDSTSDQSEAAVPGYRMIRPCSIGLSFSVRSGAAVSVSTAGTARYLRKAPADDAGGLSDDEQVQQRRPSWKRIALGYQAAVRPGKRSESWKINNFELTDGNTKTDPAVTIHVQRRCLPDEDVYTITLINTSDAGGEADRRDERFLFQAGLSVRALDSDGRPAIMPRPRQAFGESQEDAQTNALLYRNVFEFAVGHGVAASWNTDGGHEVSEVRTEWLPIAIVKGTSPEGHRTLKEFGTMSPDAMRAAFLGDERNRKAVVSSLRSFSACYGNWIAGLETRRAEFDGVLGLAAERNLTRCRNALQRIEAGISVLEKNDSAWMAFAMANAAMDRQSRFPAKGNRRRPLNWRPFQLAFILLVIPGLVDPTSDDRDCMDLLWFPTGGGKTEAYLGLIAFQIFFRRLENEERKTRGGVDVLMRYTLRLLTVQQFQRAAALILACDLIRRSHSHLLGTAQISLGLFVGNDATPNKMEDARKALEEEMSGASPRSTPRQLLRCPACGRDLPTICYRPVRDAPRIDIVCTGENCEVKGLPLPVLTVDEVIFASPPSLLIGTIDKFAQLPRSTNIRSLFGLDGGGRPALIIQDELHLISGPLGSIAGLYETAIDLLCTQENTKPKIIGSTATIGEAASQVRALFDRSVFQFPPSGFDASDSFFSVTDETGPDRCYMGVASAGRSPKFALQAVIASLLQLVQHLKNKGRHDLNILDAYWTCVSYFNSLRELGGAYVLLQDDIPRHMKFLASRLGTDVRSLELEPLELSSRVSSRDLPDKLQQLEASLTAADQDPYAAQALDAVLASNMISVGVDVPRLGLMVVNGQPKSTAEYIQASSRVGRGIWGLVITLYNFGRPRDLSHFEHFTMYHAALYRDVEATSVTPWAPRARDKALHAVVASLVRHLVPNMLNEDRAARFDRTDPAIAPLLAYIEERVGRASHGLEAGDTQEDLKAIVERWDQRSRDARHGHSALLYWERKTKLGTAAPHLMSSAEEGARPNGLAWPTPNSMRDVEPSTAFVLKQKKK